MPEKNCTDTLVELAEHNRNLVATARTRRVLLDQVRQQVGYLIDAAEPTGNGEYIVQGDVVENLRELLFGKRGYVDTNE